MNDPMKVRDGCFEIDAKISTLKKMRTAIKP